MQLSKQEIVDTINHPLIFFNFNDTEVTIVLISKLKSGKNFILHFNGVN